MIFNLPGNPQSFLHIFFRLGIFALLLRDASEEEQVIAEPLNTRPKYVVSTTLTS